MCCKNRLLGLAIARTLVEHMMGFHRNADKPEAAEQFKSVTEAYEVLIFFSRNTQNSHLHQSNLGHSTFM